MEQIKCIMLVDDNEIDKLLAQRIIEINELSRDTILVRNGIQALRKLDEYFKANNSLPEIIIVDLHMPLMNGFKLIEKIIRLPFYSYRKTKIIVLTASLDDENDKERLCTLGIRGCLLKPFDIDDFLKLINH